MWYANRGAVIAGRAACVALAANGAVTILVVRGSALGEKGHTEVVVVLLICTKRPHGAASENSIHIRYGAWNAVGGTAADGLVTQDGTVERNGSG